MPTGPTGCLLCFFCVARCEPIRTAWYGGEAMCVTLAGCRNGLREHFYVLCHCGTHVRIGTTLTEKVRVVEAIQEAEELALVGAVGGVEVERNLICHETVSTDHVRDLSVMLAGDGVNRGDIDWGPGLARRVGSHLCRYGLAHDGLDGRTGLFAILGRQGRGAASGHSALRWLIGTLLGRVLGGRLPLGHLGATFCTGAHNPLEFGGDYLDVRNCFVEFEQEPAFELAFAFAFVAVFLGPGTATAHPWGARHDFFVQKMRPV